MRKYVNKRKTEIQERQLKQGRNITEMTYTSINRELAQYNPLLTEKPQIVVLNKMDIPGTEQAAKIIQTAIKDRQVLQISAATRKGIGPLKLALVESLGNHSAQRRD